MRQRTIKSSFSLDGVGLHSGKECCAKFYPAPVGSGIYFSAPDARNANKIVHIPAQTKYVIEKKLCTGLYKDGFELFTLEHVMSALNVMGIDNVNIHLSSNEFPILDGSSLPICKALKRAGVIKQAGFKRVIQILKPIEIKRGDQSVRLDPSFSSTFAFSIDFSEKGLPPESYNFQLESLKYMEEIAPSRTFGFLKDHEWLKRQSLALGANLENSLVFDEGRCVNGKRFANEMVRHKILDAIGDLYFCGYRILGSYNGNRASHSINHMLLVQMAQDPQSFRVISVETARKLRKQSQLAHDPLYQFRTAT